MALTEPPVDPAREPHFPDGSLDPDTRQRLLAVLRHELARAGTEALARGVPPEQLAAQLDERAALLRSQIADLLAARAATSDDLTDSPDEPV